MTPGIVAESDLTGALKSEYVFFNGERVARRDFGPTGPTGVFYYFSDHLKTASVIADSAGNVKSESDYYPWGGELQFVANDSNHYKFTGKERDGETGLDYFGARYYSNGLEHFITQDPQLSSGRPENPSPRPRARPRCSKRIAAITTPPVTITATCSPSPPAWTERLLRTTE